MPESARLRHIFLTVGVSTGLRAKRTIFNWIIENQELLLPAMEQRPVKRFSNADFIPKGDKFYTGEFILEATGKLQGAAPVEASSSNWDELKKRFKVAVAAAGIAVGGFAAGYNAQPDKPFAKTEAEKKIDVLTQLVPIRGELEQYKNIYRDELSREDDKLVAGAIKNLDSAIQGIVNAEPANVSEYVIKASENLLKAKAPEDIQKVKEQYKTNITLLLETASLLLNEEKSRTQALGR